MPQNTHVKQPEEVGKVGEMEGQEEKENATHTCAVMRTEAEKAHRCPVLLPRPGMIK